MTNETSAQRAVLAKRHTLNAGHYAPVVHDLWRRLLPIALEYDRGYGVAATIYTYLLAYTNGQPENPRYMSAFPSVDKIAADTGIGRNKVTKMVNVLEAVGIVETKVQYEGKRKIKLYYPLYYSALTDDEIRTNLLAMHYIVRTK